MKPKDVPYGDRILPTEKCPDCGAEVCITNEADDEEETMYIQCPNKQDEKDGHIEYNGQPKATLIAWGWQI